MRLEAVVFDWAGTVVDFGSFAPAESFVEAFARLGVPVSVAEARGPMGRPKRDHIRAMLALPRVAGAWRSAQGEAPGEDAAERLHAAFEPINREVAARRAELIPGAAETARRLLDAGIRIGSTTGYTRAIMAGILPRAAAQGFAPEVCICADDVPRGRPGPWQMFRLFADMSLLPGPHVAKVDDTAPGIAEGVACGCLTIGVALTGNLAGLSPEALAALPEAERAALRARAGAALREAGADHVVDGVADLPALFLRLGVRL